MLAILYAALGALPLSKHIAINGRHGRHDRHLSTTTHCRKATYAYGIAETTTPPPANTPYTIVCVSDQRGGGWTYNTLLADAAVDTYTNTSGALVINAPAACIPAHNALLIMTNLYEPLLTVPPTPDLYWVRNLRLDQASDGNFSTHGFNNAQLFNLAMTKSCTVVESDTATIFQTGPIFFVSTDQGVFHGRALATEAALHAIDYERLEKDSRPVTSTFEYHLISAVAAGTSSALPLKYPLVHGQNVLSATLYFIAGFVCGTECFAARIASVVAGSLAAFRLGVDLVLPYSKLRVVAALFSHVAAAVVTFSFLNVAAGVWVPPQIFIEFQGSLNAASALELLPIIWRLL